MRCHRAARRSRARVVAVGLVLALLARSRAARADSSFALSWRERPAACVTETALRSVVTEKLGRDPFIDRERADIVIEGDETSAGARLGARVVERDRDGVVLGSREIDAESCPRLIRATGLVVALFVKAVEERESGADRGEQEEHGAPRTMPEEVHTEAEPGARPEALPPAPPPPVPAPRESSRPGPRRGAFELSLGAGASASVGILPSASAALRGVARLERSSSVWSFEWTAGYTLPQSFRSRAVRGTLSAVDQQVRACLDLLPERSVRLDACGGAFWGAVVPHTAGLTERSDAWRPLAGPEAALAVQLREGARSGRLELGVAAPVVGRTFYFESVGAGQERLYSTGRVILFVGVSGLLTIL
ncbi:MAG: hypothetical protein KF795_04005 [Labilithrix sp.]|nr:hypothetical protein [Labilithrix sp.]